MNSSQGRRRVVATAVVAAAAMVLSVLPLAAAVGTTGAWIFPHAHQSDALGGSLSNSFYMGSNSSEWVSDSFFADSLADSANVQADLYNPTSSDLSSVQLFVAISDISLLTSIDFAGGDGGAVSVPASDIGGGTPFLADGSTLPAHGVYPAHFTSYSVGSLAAGSAGIVTVWVNVTGDFGSGLIIHLDYAGVDDSGVVFTGPFDADMAIFENGEADEEPPCDDLGGIVAAVEEIMDIVDTNEPTVDIIAQLDAGSAAPTSNIKLTLLMPPELVPGTPTAGETTGQVWVWSVGSGEQGDSWNASVPVRLSPTILDGDVLPIIGNLTWDSCGETHVEPLEFNVEASFEATGDLRSASWWQTQIEKTSKSKKNAEFSKGELDGFLQAVAAHSSMFTYGLWNGTAPNGDSDDGWIDIDTLREALEVLKGKSGDSKKVRGIEREALALWLNVASGAVNLDTPVGSTRHCDDNDSDDDDGEGDDDSCEDDDRRHRSAFEQRTGLCEPGDDLDTVGEILAFAEGQSADWKDGSGGSKDDLKLGRLLCRAVNRGWLVPQ